MKLSPFQRVLAAFSGSVLLHLLVLGALSILPDAAALAPPEALPADQEPASLEIVLQTVPEPEAEPTPALTAAELPPATLASASAQDAPEPIRTFLDPRNLTPSEEAPKDAKLIAAHHSKGSTRAKATPAPAAPESEATASITSAPPPAPPEQENDGEEGSIAAIGEWNKAVSNSIGERWNHYREEKTYELAVGTVIVSFTIDAQGRPSKINVVSNTAGKANADHAVKAVKEARIPPIPPERLARLPDGEIEIKFEFTIYPTQ